FERNLAGVQAVLASAEEIVSAEAAQAGAEYRWIVTDGRANTGVWRYPDGTFVHPQALEVIGNTAYLLDRGRVLGFDLAEPALPKVLLAPGDDVAGVRVLEPLDLTTVPGRDDPSALLVLDRAGDVYRYEPGISTWSVELYGRPSGETSDHYYVALTSSGAGRYLLETTHEKVWRFYSEGKGTAWATVPKSRDVDIGAIGQDVYVLTRAMSNPTGILLRYLDGQQVTGFRPAVGVALMHPRQVHATESTVYVLDRAGRRLLALDPQDGKLQALYQFPDRRAVSALWAGPSSRPGHTEEVILAGRDALYFYGWPERQAVVEGEPLSTVCQAYDPVVLESLRGLLMPIDGAHFTSREFQSPGAPRHYRLGVHEGSDFYTSTTGVTVNRSTKVRAVADGIVVRALLDYQPLTSAQAEVWAAESQRLGYTPPEVLDGYRGQQVWIEHEGGLVSRYAHLGSIAAGIEVGARVKRGQVIGTVGNSGTPESLNGPNGEVHLHLELWLGDYYIGQFMRPIETREWLEKILR
ncbi:MAG: M23 family metallopeptidase, partial [Anaerolineae bacterium]|nr:M23 family metallopeptidase [Anaerolineae bacterium]